MSGNANQRRRRPGSRDVEASGSRAGYSPQGSREICRDFMGGACARGTKCRFSHIQPVENQTNTGQASASVPHDACRAYWNTGTCSRGNNCKFQHRRPTDPTPAEAPKDLQSHFEAAGLGVFPGLANDQFSPGGSNETPGRTHYQLKIYMEDSFRFQTEGQVYRFLELVCNASSQNPNWKPEDGHKHFHELVKGNGILRLGDAIRFPAETSRPWSFQRGYIPILTYLSSEWVVKSTIHSNINALYGLVHNEFEVWKNTIEQHMSRLMSVRSFKDGPKALSGKQVFKVLFVTLFEYLTRFKQAMTTNPEVFDFVIKVCEWFEEWATALRSTPRFDDECSGYEDDMKDYIIDNLRRDKERALHVIGRGRPRIAEPAAGHQQPASTEGLVAILQRNCDYEGPGELRERGPRHDNDFVSIREIRIPPTNRELMSADDPYLPPNFVEAPHFLESKSVERLLDIQFRLLREELIAPIRMAVQLIVSDWQKPSSATTMLSKLIAAGGGRYAAPGSAQESVIFSVFTNVDFEPLSASNRGTSVGVVFDTPPGKARAEEPDARAAYWEQISKKRLMLGGLVALIWKDPAGVVDIYVGTISSTPRDLADAARKSKDRISLRVSFFDTIAELRIVRAFQNRRENNGSQILIEAPVFYEGIRPFLEALKKEPELLPFSHYLCHQSREELAQIQIAPPVYSLAPRFSFELKDLFPTSAGVQSLSLVTNNPDSVARAKATLIRSSRLDPSQADAVVDSLTREISLIQGPPGTGKSYTGLELIRVLIKNQVSPILLVAFTNHALDHMLNGILDAEITKNIIRLGSRSDDRIAQFSLDATEKLQSKSMLDRDINAAYRGMKTAEEEMTALMKKIALRQIPLDHIEDCILSSYPFHYDELFSNAPSWISTLVTQANENQEGWETVGSSSRDLSIIGFWAYSRDLLFLETPKVPTPEASSSQQPVASLNAFDVLSADAQGTGETSSPNLAAQHHAFVAQFMSQHGLNKIPPIPTSDRPIGNLLADPRVWSMSRNERARLYDRWYMAASESTRQTQVEEFENLRKNHSDAHRAWAELKEQARVNILRRAHIIGCTTTGAAKVISVLSAVEPKVMIVEEAGQVLESHILASLVQSIQHVVMIGDPLQLRPSINSYKLATDNRITGMIYRFDQSLMERLSSGGFPMSQLDVQRRMRPTISSLIKNTLYPKLQDHPLVLEYPKVRGMHKDVFFVSHSNKEAGGGEDSVSKHNEYEINMIYDLVLHLLRQGCYSKSGNIVILAAYLGQIPKIRKKLQDVVTTIIDDRDSELLVQYGLEDEEVEAVQRVQVSTRVLIRTLDNFQGEEGDVIILSLVRNSGTKFEGDLSSLRHVPGARSQIGFLKSTNRMNVGLSRAKHGMYIFGNAPELSRNSQMWASVLQELHESGCVGKALPISCHRHPSYVEWIDQPGRLKIVSPDGGCLEPCLAPLRCGHRCPFKCHSDDPHHATTRCQEPCLKLCPLSHPCDRQCWECAKVLGDCRFPVRNVPLPCGHTHPKAQCYLARLPEKIKCVTTVTKQLPFCEHSARMPCHQDPAKYVCQERCGAAYSCCSKSCSASCGTCQKLNTHTTTEVQIGRIKRINHPKHPCGRILFCGHTCKDDCVKGHTCSGSCKQQCRQICSHGSCRLPCSSPCKPCVRPCGWNCAHGKCQSACGMACTRLPCDIKCPKMLKCGHPCPSVCGEPCEVQTCKKCASDNTLDSIVDLVMHISLRDLEDDTGLDSMTITLPCRHVFTVETLDGHTQLGDFYEKNQAGNWIKPIIPQSSGETRKRPVCPTCRGDISSLRYGRVCKNSNLAIMQHNIASSLSQRLSQAESKLSTARNQVNSAISEALKKCLPVASTTDLTPELRQQRLDKLEIALAREVDRPTPVETLQNLGTFHPFPEKDAKLWKGAVSALLESYRMARQIACNRDPSVQAYEASLATLYQEELNYFGVDMSRGVPSDVEQRALRLARMRIGQPPPRASLRFVVEAFWITIDILMLLGTATDQASGEVRQREGCTHNSSYWSTLAKFFFERAVEDAGVALKLAEGSESWNKAVKCQLVVLRAKYELAAYRCRTAVDTRAISDPEVREASVKMCDQGIQYLQGLQSTVPQNYLRRWSGEELVERHQWVTENFSQPSNVLLDSWKQIRRSAKSGTWYSEVTNEERLEIMRAMMQGSRRDRPLMHTGHFYQCPNGHPYVIGECGGAMQESRCPECGARIGGHDHRAAVGNRHAADFVNLAREAGAEESPWRWGPNRGRP